MDWLDFFPKPSPYYGIWKQIYDMADMGVPEEKKDEFLNQSAFFLSMLPVIGDIGYMADSFRSFNDYMKNYGLEWSDIVYPWMAGRKYGGGSVRSMYGSLNFVSANLTKLYR